MAKMEIIWSRTAKKSMYAILERHIRKDKGKDPSKELFNNAIEELNILAKYPFAGLRTTEDNILAFTAGSIIFLYEISGKRIIIHTISEK